MDGGHNSTTSLGSSMEQVMRPKSPLPGLVDFHGKRKQMVKIQVLEREIVLLQEELKSLEGLHPASRCCKELDAFVGSVSDPFTPTRKQTISKSHHFRKQISLPCCNCCLMRKKMAKGCWSCCSSSLKSKCCGRSCLKSACTSRCALNCC